MSQAFPLIRRRCSFFWFLRVTSRHSRDAECAAVLGKDSDFFVLPVPYYLVLDTLKLHANPPLVTAYARADVLRLLQLDERHLPLFASLCGNDFVQVKKKKTPPPLPLQTNP